MLAKKINRWSIATLAVFAVLSFSASGLAATGTTHNASGTYTWNAGTGTFTLNTITSDFTCNGPSLGTETHVGVTITVTTMTWPNDPMTWTRSSGTAGDIVGIWTGSDSTTGNSYTLTFNANLTVSVTGVIVSCSGGGQNPSANSRHWSNGYYVQLQYDDSPKTATAVSVTGPGISGSKVLTYNAGDGSWNSNTSPSTQVFFGTTYPAGLPYAYTFTITDATGTWTASSTVSCFQEPFATNISPTGTVTGTPTFSWTGISDSSAIYGVQVNDSSYNRIWQNNNISGTSIVYNGPALTPGMNYNYNVDVESSSACSSGTSFAQGSFTYGSGGGTISFNGWVKTTPSWPSTGDMAAVNGATVNALPEAGPPPLTSTMSNNDGTFSITGIPASSTFRLVVQPPAGTAYVPVLSKFMNWNDNIQALLPFALFTQTQYAAFGNAAGTGMILGRVALKNSPTTFLAGAVIEAREWTSGNPPVLGATYPVTYTSGSSTQADGIYMVKNVPAGKLVQLVVTLPNHTFEFNAAVIPVQAGFISEESFFGTQGGGGATISFSGVLTTFANDTPVGGATVEMVGNTSITTTTATTDGSFTLSGLPSGTEFSVKITGNTATDVPTYTAVQQSTTPLASARGFNLFTPAELSGWGVTGGNGAIRGRVMNGANALAGYVSGATVTYTSLLGRTDYIVKYEDNSNNFTTGTGTSANGKFYILNVVEGDTVTVSAARSNYTFPSRKFVTHAGAVSQGSISGSAIAGRVAIAGYIKDSATTPLGIKNVTIDQVGATAPGNSTTSNGDGSFYLSVPATTTIQLKFSKPQAATPLAPTYTADMSFGGDNLSLGDFNLHPATALSGWGILSGKGIIRARAKDQAGNYLGGATVSYTSGLGRTYAVCYDDACSGTYTSTQTTGSDAGRYVIKNVEPGDTVTVTAAKTGYAFNTRVFHTYADSVHQGGITETTANNSVSGNISYSGSQAGNFKIMLWSADITGSYYQELTLTSGSFTFNNVPNGRYFLSSYRDSNNNSQYTAGEAYGYYQDTSGLKVAVVNGASANIGAVTLADPSGTTGASVSISAAIGAVRGYLVFFRSGDSLKNNNNPVFTLDLGLVTGFHTYPVTQMRRNYEGMPVPAGTYDFYFLTGDLENGPDKGVVQYMQPGVVISKGSVTNIPASGSIPFNAGGTVSGTVTSSYSTHSLPGVMVYLSADQTGQIISAWGRTNANGQFQFEHVPAGTYYLILSYTGFNVFTPVTITVTEGGTLAVPGTGTVITPTQIPGTISGNLTPFGTGVDSRILLKQGETVIANVAANASDGSYSISDVVPGSYTLVGSARGYTPIKVSVTVTVGQTLTQNYTLNGTKSVIINGLNWLLAHQRADGSFDDNLSGNADQYVFGWTGYTGLTLLAVLENPKYNVSTSPDYLGVDLLRQIHDALYGVTGATPKNGIKQYFESTYRATDDSGTPWNDVGAFYNNTVSWASVAATPVALEKLIALGLPLNDPKVTGAVQFLLNAQITAAKASNPIFAGGWRDHPGNTDTDTWETAWVIMALMKAGVNPSVQAVMDGLAHIRRSQITEGGGAGLFAYQPNDTIGYGPLGTSAASILALNFAGAPNVDPYVDRFFQWVKNNGEFGGFDRWAEAYWWSMFPWAAILYADPDRPGKTMYDTLALTWNMADDIILRQNSNGSWSNPNFISGGSNSGNTVMYTASALMAIAPYAGLTPRPEEVAISGVVTRDNTAPLSSARIDALLGGHLSATATTDGSGVYTLSVPKNYTYTVRVVPPQAYPGYARKSIEVIVGTIAVGGQNITYTAADADSTAPTLTSPNPTNNVGAPYNAPISVIASDNDGIDPATIVFKLDNVPVGAVYTMANGKITYYPLSAVSNVTHTVQVDAKDYAQNPAMTLTWTFTPVLRGDISGDSVVNLADAIIAMQALSGLTPTIRANYAASGADVNGDNKVGLHELLYILQYVAGLR